MGKCLVCPESRYEALECHRVVPGAEGGTYETGNMVALCATCHALVTAGKIVIGRLCLTSTGRWLAPVTTDDGKFRWIPLEPHQSHEPNAN